MNYARHSPLFMVISNSWKSTGSASRAGSSRSFYKKPGVLVSVTDKGKGIKAQDHARLFQRFVRLEGDLNSIVRGSGLGLYISRRLIEAMDGNIWIESSGIAGAGSTFHFQLPAG